MRSPCMAVHTRSRRCMYARSPNQAVPRMRCCALCSSPRLILCIPRSACWTWPRASQARPEEVKLYDAVRTTLAPQQGVGGRNAMTMNSLLQLTTCGQSYWLDNLTRDMITDGELHTRVTEQGLRGVTSNPATFHKAIVGSSAYDAQIKQLVGEGRETTAIYEHLVVADVQDACDILRPVYDASAGVDGFVSLEVSPYLAHDALGTMQEARRLFSAVDRPNVFIKIPGTPAGIPAIEEMLYEGVTVNITLLFGLKDYENVAQAYIRALERRRAEGKPVNTVASVASFFLSRIDVLVDQLLGHRLRPGLPNANVTRCEQLLGRVAIANAKLAYQSFKRLFGSDRWHALAAQGARVQRPLWASTSTKKA